MIVSLGVVLLLRPLWLILTQSLPHTVHTRRGRAAPRDDDHLTGREVVVLSWAGTRGVISLAAIFTLPLVVWRGAVPKRDLLLFCTYVVVVVTLVVQGITFAPLARALGVRADPADAVRLRAEARAAAVQAARARLNQIASDGDAPEPALASCGPAWTARRALSAAARPAGNHGGRRHGPAVPPGYEAAVQARRAVIDAQREELLRWRDAAPARLQPAHPGARARPRGTHAPPARRSLNGCPREGNAMAKKPGRPRLSPYVKRALVCSCAIGACGTTGRNPAGGGF